MSETTIIYDYYTIQTNRYMYVVLCSFESEYESESDTHTYKLSLLKGDDEVNLGGACEKGC